MQPRHQPRVRSQGDKATSFVISYGNVTAWSDKVRDFILDVTPVQMVAIAETHVAAEAPANASWLRKNGWRHWWTPAQPSMKSQDGTCGGTGILARAGYRVSSILAELGGTQQVKELVQEALDWTAVVIHLRGMRVLFVVVYCTHTIGFQDNNLLKLGQIGALIDMLDLPFIVVGDWNQPPAELAAVGWLHDKSICILPPAELEHTCTNGHRVIDYMVCSPLARRLVKYFGIDSLASWSPHLGLKIELDTVPMEVHLWGDG